MNSTYNAYYNSGLMEAPAHPDSYRDLPQGEGRFSQNLTETV
jgi:hypothetical protein